MAEQDLSMERLREVLDYDPRTGWFMWKQRVAPRAVIGTRAGSAGPNGTWFVRVDKHQFYAHRLAWFYVNGRWPEGHLVPLNGDYSDSRIENLREQPRAMTVHQSAVRTTNTSGFRGVSWNIEKNKWVASISRDYRRIHLGLFDTKEEAAAAYERAAAGDLPEGGTPLPRKPSEARRTRWATFEKIRNAPHLVGWATLEAFIADMGEPPTDEHVLMRARYEKPLGPGNAEWRLPWRSADGEGNAASKRNYHLGRFGLTNVEYRKMLGDQNGVCAICERPERSTRNGKTRLLSVDHCHATGKTRSLLCSACNAMLGLVEDDRDILRRAASYLDRHAAASLPTVRTHPGFPAFREHVVPIIPLKDAA